MISYRELVQNHDFRPSKALGQNFLHSIDQARRIVSKAGIADTDHVFEIGSGSGVLTQALWEKAKAVASLEIDRRLFALTSRHLVAHNMHWFAGDALQFDFDELKNISSGPWHAVSNLPYACAVPILFRLLERSDMFCKATLMFQKEVAERLLAGPGSKAYGALTVCAANYAEIKRLLSIKRTNFLPQPKVESVVLQFTLKQTRPFAGEKEAGFLTFVRQIFHYRRKQLGNSLRTEKGFAFPLEHLLAVFAELKIDLKRRPESLSAAELEALYRQLL